MNEHDLTVTRAFDAPRALVFQAWTDPRHLIQWWGPRDFQAHNCALDLRVGGSFRLELVGPDGQRYPCAGVFREIVEPERIVFAGTGEGGHSCGAGLPPHAIVTITFAEQEGKTTLTIHTRFDAPASRDAASEAGYHIGWTQSLERLAEALAST